MSVDDRIFFFNMKVFCQNNFQNFIALRTNFHFASWLKFCEGHTPEKKSQDKCEFKSCVIIQFEACALTSREVLKASKSIWRTQNKNVSQTWLEFETSSCLNWKTLRVLFCGEGKHLRRNLWINVYGAALLKFSPFPSKDKFYWIGPR